MERETLTNLVKAAQAGDSTASQQLFEASYQDIYYFILKIAKEQTLAEDLTQDAFLRIWEKLGELNSPEAYISWSRQIAHHCCSDYFRKRKEFLLEENEDGTSVFDTLPEEDAEFIPHEALDREDLKQTLLAMLDSLPQEQRAAMVLRYYDELSVAQIAQVQKVSEGTVKSRLNYGRKAMAKCVEDYEKRNGIKLHSIGILPVLLWLFRQQKLSKGVSFTGPSTSTSTSASTSASASAAAAVTTGAKAVSTSIWAKIIAAIVAASLIIAGVIAIPSLVNRDPSGSHQSVPKKPLYESDLLKLDPVAAECQPDFVEYLNNDANRMRTSDGSIRFKAYDGSWETFRFDGVKDAKETFSLDEYPAYYDGDHVLHVYVLDQWYAYPDLVGEPYWCQFYQEVDKEPVFEIYCLEKGSLGRKYVYGLDGRLIQEYTHTALIDGKVAAENIDEMIAPFFHDFYDGRIGHYFGFVVDGMVYQPAPVVDGFDESNNRILYYVGQTGIQRENLFSKPTSERIVYTYQDNTRLYIDNYWVPMPDGRTTDEISYAYATDHYAVVFLEDQSVYYGISELENVFHTRELTYSPELTSLNQAGHIQEVLGRGLRFVMDDHFTYFFDPANIPMDTQSDTESILGRSSFADTGMIAEYVDNTLSRVRTTDNKILQAKGLYETFDYSGIDNVREAFLIPVVNERNAAPAYYDNNGVLHMLHGEVWYTFPEVTGIPYSCSNLWISPYSSYQSLEISCYQPNQPLQHFCYFQDGFYESYTTPIETMDGFISNNIYFVEWNYAHWHNGSYHSSHLFVADGELFVYCADSDTDYVRLGVREEDLLSNLSDTYIVQKVSDNTKILAAGQELSLPSGKTSDRITMAATDKEVTVAFFDDGEAYLYLYDSPDPIYSAELTALYQSGKIHKLNSYYGVSVVLTTNEVYRIYSFRVAALTNQEPS